MQQNAQLDCRETPPQRERLDANDAIERHRHVEGYVSIVLEGGYYEVGDWGRRWVGSGDVLAHFPFDAHGDKIGRRGVSIFNFCLPHYWPVQCANGRLNDVDALAVAMERGAPDIGRMVLDQMQIVPPTIYDWPDQLAVDIKSDFFLGISVWAEAHGLDPATVSRGFKKAYGVAPVAYRHQLRTKAAWNAILSHKEKLCQIALNYGFSDQAHMTRAVQAMTGQSPSMWRRKVKFVQ